MSSESGERRPARSGGNGSKPTEPEHLPCPRCDSTNTKFCYYNNYNLSQPRHFCKSCRRYWTQGGTLRNVPVGGGTRKSTHKRPRTTTTSTATSTTTSSSSSTTNAPEVLNSVPVSMISEMGHVHGPDSSVPLLGCEVNLNEALPETGSFSSLLTTHVGNGGFMNLHQGYGIGIGPGLHGMGFGLGMLDWPMQPIAQGHGGDGVGSTGGGGNAGWQIGGVEGGLNDGDCFGWPELAISTPGNALK